MYDSLDVFQTAAAMAKHAGARQALVARNIANADTPGYKAEHIAAFKEAYEGHPAASMRTTRSGHMGGQSHHSASREVVATTSEPSPNGNTVSIEDELLNSVAVSREHSRALTIYRHSMTVLRTSLGQA